MKSRSLKCILTSNVWAMVADHMSLLCRQNNDNCKIKDVMGESDRMVTRPKRSFARVAYQDKAAAVSRIQYRLKYCPP